MTSRSTSSEVLVDRIALLVMVWVLAGAFIVSVSSGEDSVLYTARDSSVTGFHQDLLATGNLTRTDASLVLNEWAMCLNLSGPIVQTIKDRDFESADDGIEQFTLSGQSLSDLVAQFALKDTQIGKFQDENNAVLWSLRELVEQRGSYDELMAEQAISLKNGNVSGLKSVEVRGEELRSSIRWNYQEYAARSSEIINISRSYGLDTERFEQSVRYFKEILDEIDTEQEQRQKMIPEKIREIQDEWCASQSVLCLPPSALILGVFPSNGTYGDTLGLNGTVLAAEGTRVDVFVDGHLIGGALSDANRRFSIPFRIEKGRAGTHTAYASLDTMLSKVTNFTVDMTNTSISLDARVVSLNGTWVAIGSGRLVTQTGVPVRGARVYVNVDGRTSLETGFTGDDGEFSISTGPLPTGTRTLTAWFESDDLPLAGSTSPSVTVDIPQHLEWLTSIVYLFGFGGAIIGSIFFLRKKRPEEEPVATVITVNVPEITFEPPPLPSLEEANSIADTVVMTVDGRIDGRATIKETYRRLVFEMDARHPDLHLRSETPRDLSELFAKWPYGPQLKRLVEVHEKIQYAENNPTEDDLQVARESFITVLTEGTEHEG